MKKLIALKNRFRMQFRIAGSLLLLILIVEIINLATMRSLNSFGIIPRHTMSLPFIFTAPFIHSGVWHFISNALPLLVLSLLLLQYGKNTFYRVLMSGIVINGLLVWFFARTAIHIGASGVIYTFFGFLLFAGWWNRELKSILISVAVAFFYGGMVFGVLPRTGHISWESHLFGFITGAAAAYIWAHSRKRRS